MINLLRDLSGAAVFPQPEHRDLPVMIAAHEQESVFIVGGKILNHKTGRLRHIDMIRSEQESAPRHLKFSKDGRYLYIVHELKNYIDVYTYEEVDGNPETQVTIISRHLHTVDMGSEIPFRNTPQPLVINLLRDLSTAG